jgi:hypothetical protein
MKSPRDRKMERAVFIMCLAAVLGILIWLFKKQEAPELQRRNIVVTVEGHVQRPGTYHVKYGATLYDVLKTAGVNQNSDLRNLDVAQVVTNPKKVNVGKLDQPVSIKGGTNTCALTFFMNTVEVFDEKGEKIDIVTGMILKEKYSVSVGDNSFAELDFGSGRTVVVNKKSRIELRSIRPSLEETFLPSGKIRIKINPGDIEVRKFRVRTPVAFTDVKGSEGTFEHDPVKKITTILVESGLFEVVSAFNDTVSAMIGAGEYATVRGKDARTAVIDRGVASQKDLDAIKKEIEKIDKDYLEAQKKAQAVNFLYIGTPGYYVFARMDPAIPRITVMHIPGATSVGEYAPGVDALSSAIAYGPGFATSMVERIIGMKVQYYFIQEREQLVNTINIINGIEVDVDAGAANYLGIDAGINKLNGLKAVRFMSPGISGPAGTTRRQNKLMWSVFKRVNEKKLVITVVLFNRILPNMRVSPGFDSRVGMEMYDKFTSKSGWRIAMGLMPGTTGEKKLYKPAYNEIRKIFTE